MAAASASIHVQSRIPSSEGEGLGDLQEESRAQSLQGDEASNSSPFLFCQSGPRCRASDILCTRPRSIRQPPLGRHRAPLCKSPREGRASGSQGSMDSPMARPCGQVPTNPTIGPVGGWDALKILVSEVPPTIHQLPLKSTSSHLPCPPTVHLIQQVRALGDDLAVCADDSSLACERITADATTQLKESCVLTRALDRDRQNPKPGQTVKATPLSGPRKRSIRESPFSRESFDSESTADVST
ncbi:hypothetical protein QBC46DRAFT_445852 [Diplogelasinospora grovesii]|uniref:Uncharacterized protein n=1 Tax=Diplogelasinospora grovesii TaxID=303347 RepID=A0AAN6NF36_9PEZI|nr:hypothetical protein QBC46DRAFT_445852 [Diplogelasinospora grovesii]